MFETVSRDAYFSIWNARSPTDLVPMSLNPLKGKWLSSITGIGASIDSFYEYALKGAILFDDSELMTVWKKSYQALMSHAKMSWFMTNVHADTAMIVTPWVDALSAFFPGLLVLSGKVENAMTLYMPF
uniref:alpha-1,2-Mannosidase n=1 Tax=uncultured Zygosaccharomyces TaxID=1054455 RepID=A0A060CHX8_9SACH|nr:Glyco_hydro_47 [uncultured Zygosaccharomyces]